MPDPSQALPQPRRKIRVAQIITSVVLGGGGQFTAALARNIDRAAFEVDIYCVLEGGELVEYIRALGFRVEVLPVCRTRGPIRYDVQLWASLVSELKRGRYDIVHTSLFRADLVGGIAARLAGCRVLVKTLHNMGTRKRAYHRLVDRLLQGVTDRVVCVAAHQRRTTIERDRVPAAKVVEIVNGVRMERFEHAIDRAAVAARVGLDPSRPIIGTVGRLIQEKGQTYLLQAMPSICAEVPGAQLLIVGDGELRQELASKAQDLGIAARTVITGLRPDVPDLLGAMDVFAFPSLSEGSPIAALEAMAACVPVACSDIPALVEIIRHEETGLISRAGQPEELARSVIRLLRDDSLRERLAIRARELVRQEYSEAAMTRAYERLYSQEYQSAND